jgi:hypothetical protein
MRNIDDNNEEIQEPAWFAEAEAAYLASRATDTQKELSGSNSNGQSSDSDEEEAGADAPASPSPAELKAACASLVSKPDILSVIDETLRATGFAGPTWPVQLVALAIYSRHLSKPVSVVLRGESASGKSHIIKRALEFASPEAHYGFTAMSAKALYYEDAELSHRMLVAYEGQGLVNDTLAYAIRSLLSEGRLEYRYVDFESRANVSVTKEGPTGLITSTAGRLDYELGTRVMTISTDDSPDITAAIMLAEADQAEGNLAVADTEAFHALDRWIGLNRVAVVVPFARRLSVATDSRAVRMRRDFPSVLGLVQAHALLHRESRSTNELGHLLATVDDYAAVHGLVSDLVAYASGEAVPPEIRETVDVVRELITPPRFDGVTVADVAKELDIHRTSAQRRLNRAVSMGFLSRSDRRPGQASLYEWERGVPGDSSVLPDPDDLR